MISSNAPNANADIAVIGLAVMGQNLILNLNDHGFTVCAYNRTVSKVHDFLGNQAKGTKVVGAETLEEMVGKCKRAPRKVLLMVKAGEAVDDFIEQLVPLLARGDIIIDGGNSHFADTERRCKRLESLGLLYVGLGVSGGEEGARHGPSLMPGGSPAAWPHLQPILTAIAAKASNQQPCCAWIGAGGAGHYVKMVHNGIEYGDMQLISEAYHLMRNALNMSTAEMAAVFAGWSTGKLDSFLIAITRDILLFKDANGESVVERILDVAGQKGTGKWTVVSSLDLGSPATLIAEAVFARGLSGLKRERTMVAHAYNSTRPSQPHLFNNAATLEDLQSALYASKIMSYAQGFALLQKASQEHKWNIDCGSVALMWRGGCIIRSVFLEDIERAYKRDPNLPSLLLDPFFKQELYTCVDGWRRTLIGAITAGIPMPCHTAALSFFDGIRTSKLPANLIQAQRDYFGAHTFEFVERPGVSVHLNWTGAGGDISSSAYNA